MTKKAKYRGLEMNRRVVISGIGLLTPIGNTSTQFFNAALAGKSGIRQISKFDTTGFAVQMGGEIELADGDICVNENAKLEMPRSAQWAVHAARSAVRDADLSIKEGNSNEIGVVMGVGAPAFDFAYEQTKTLSKIDLRTPVVMNPGAAAVQISVDLGLQGEVLNISTACSSSAHAIGYATRLIQHGDLSCVLCGGVDEGINPVLLSAFGNGKVLSIRNAEPSRASRPFDRQRDGYILSDGACVLVLEDYERARRRNARIYCEVTGYGSSSDATSPMKVGKSEEPAARAISKALAGGGTDPKEVDYYCAHGSSSRWTDIRETRAIRRVFQERSSKLHVSSIKSMIGHPLGAAGAIQVATAALAIQNKAIPPTINNKLRRAGSRL
jgi:3-oxoacyl-[acyl-carrier-protein] synthase II